jgi:putative oxidoreductase
VARVPARMQQDKDSGSCCKCAPRTVWAGAVLAMAATGGAIFSHLTFLGLVVMEDGGLLFALALIVFATSAVSIFLHRSQIPVVGKRY